MKNILQLLSITALLGLFTGLPAGAGEINLSAAASFREVIGAATANFTVNNPSVRFFNNIGASGALAKQIDNGAPADIFIAANQEWMVYLRTRNRMAGDSVRTLAHNSLVFVGDPAKKVASLPDLLKLERIAIGSPKSVPAGEYALEAIRNAGLEKYLQKRLVMAKDVRECLLYAERGEVDGAFVYGTDALQAKKVQVLFRVPQELYSPVTYPLGLTVAGAGNKDALAFYRYLHGEEVKKILRKYGFALP